jgi:hypothetical protein
MFLVLVFDLPGEDSATGGSEPVLETVMNEVGRFRGVHFVTADWPRSFKKLTNCEARSTERSSRTPTITLTDRQGKGQKCGHVIGDTAVKLLVQHDENGLGEKKLTGH